MSKVKIADVKEKVFMPFVVEITIETANEAREIWHRFNLASTKFISSIKEYDLFECKWNGMPTINTEDICDVLYKEMESQGIKP